MLLDALSARQQALKWSHGQMAAELGISREVWVQCLQRRRATISVIRGAVARFPDLGDVVLRELRGERREVAAG